MAKARLIPKLQLFPSAIDLGSLSIVNTVNFNKIIEIGSPVSQARIYDAQLADELILVDLTSAKGLVPADPKRLLQTLQDVAKEVFLPLTIGGGIDSLEDVAQFLANGADKVCINSSAVNRPSFISEIANAFGSQCVLVSIDYKRNANGKAEVFSNGGSMATGLEPLAWAEQVEELGAGEILLTCIDRDGDKSGLDLSIARELGALVTCPVIVSGGCGVAQHFIDGFSNADVDAIAAGTFFSFRDQNPMQTRGHIKNAGINIRTGS